VERLARSAADALRNADVLLVATGAGFSADSGLATYDVRSVAHQHLKPMPYWSGKV
jgi:NAD-dependent SIR2 family protein deacetylase